MLSRRARTFFFRLWSADWLINISPKPREIRPRTEYLLGYDVKDGMNGLDFGESEFFKGAGNSIKIVVEYDIKLYFWGLFLKDNSLHVVQRVDIPAWLDGDGKSYKKK